MPIRFPRKKRSMLIKYLNHHQAPLGKIPLTSLLLAFLLCMALQVTPQSTVNHNLIIELDDLKHVVNGTDSLIFINTSGDTLKDIWFFLYPNMVRRGSALSEYMLRQGNPKLSFSVPGQQGEMGSLIFREQGRALRWEYFPSDSTMVRVELLKPLLPDSSVSLLVFFRTSVPQGSVGLLGHDSQSYFLSQWFPQPLCKWPYGQKPDCSHIAGIGSGVTCDFLVTITLPRNYTVATSGVMQEDAEENKWLDNLEEKTRKVSRWSRREQAGFPVSAQKTKKLTYKLSGAEDFALCLDKRFYFLHDTLYFPEANREVHLHLYFTSYEAVYWSNALETAKQMIRFMVEKTGAFPYPQLSVVQTTWNNGGNAYPGMIRIGSVMSAELMEAEMAKQIASQWFGISLPYNPNEEYWFREGISGHYANRFLKEQHRDTLSLQDMLLDPSVQMNFAGLKDHPVTRFNYFRFALLQEDERQPVITPYCEFTAKNRVSSGQIQSMMAFDILVSQTDAAPFDLLMKEFYRNWMGKHPDNEQFFNFLKENSATAPFYDTFAGILNQTRETDYAITHCRRVPSGYLIKIKNRGNVPLPYQLTLNGHWDSRTEWKSGHTGSMEISIADSNHTIRRISLDARYNLPEYKKSNNTIHTSGIFRKVEPIRITPWVALPDMQYTRLNVSPIVGWNAANGFMVGVASYSNPVFRPETEYLLMPLYGFTNRQLAGIFRLSHRFRPDFGPFFRIEASLEAKRYGYDNQGAVTNYQRLMPSVTFHFRNRDIHQISRSRLTLRSLWIAKDAKTLVDTIGNIWIADHYDTWYMNEISWRYRNGNLLLPFRSVVTLQQSGQMVRFWVEGQWFFPYKKYRKGFSARVFGGIVLSNPDGESPWDYRFTTSGTAMYTKGYYRPHDPLFDYQYLGRSNAGSILMHHFYLSEGGFKRITTVGNTSRWMATVNLGTTLPGRIPLELFFDAGIFADDSQDQYFKGIILFSSGAKFILFRDVAEIYFPFTFFESPLIREREKINNLSSSYIQTIRIVLNLQQLNPLTLPSKIRL
jgi:hypothetical protein